MGSIVTSRDPWTCTFCKKNRPAGTMRRNFVRNREKGTSCIGHNPRDHDFETNCDFALRYVVEMETHEGRKTVCATFRSIGEARRHAAVYTGGRLIACYPEGYPHVVFTTRLAEFNAWAAAQDWVDQHDYHTERYLARPGLYGDLLWMRDERNAVMAKTVWGETFSFS